MLHLFSVLVMTLCAVADAGDDPVSFAEDVHPLLAENCLPCHGPDKKARKARLQLDVRESSTKARRGGAAIVPGRPDDSEVLRRITSSDPDDLMPPPDSGKKLATDEIALLRQWIVEGAKYERHWAYIAPRRSPPPAVKDASWPSGEIDHFILARLEKERVAPSEEADRRTLARRLSFDLVGMAPDPSEVESFEDDEHPDAYERLVDRLLASPQFGERVAVYWMDLVRFADTAGIHADNTWDIFPYRDYVIEAINADTPFDQFTREQLAGDLMAGALSRQRIASSYNRLNMISREGGSQAKEFLIKYTADRVRNVTVVWLGATLGCAECHDHKFDPLTSKEFYQFGAFFADIEQVGVYLQGAKKSRFFPPYLPLPTDQQAAERAEIERRIKELKKILSEEASGAPAEEIKKLEERRKKLDDKTTVIIATKSVKPMTARVLPRGDWMDESGEIVQPAVPAAFGSLGDVGGAGGRATRLDLADWLMRDENPAVARVFVNRIWRLLFGRGIVSSLDDFGRQGTLPTHPRLLDHLALEFRDSGWSLRHLVRTIVLSTAYRQSSIASDGMRRRDPFNELVARQGRFRLDAEFIRDTALRVSGLLSRRLGGPSVRPYQPVGYYSHLNFPRRTYRHDKGESLYRRSLYTHWQRQFVHPSLLAFDAPSRERCTVERMRSNTPLGALVLLNDPIYVEAARAFGAMIVERGGKTTDERIRFAFRRALNRSPRENEMAVLRDVHAQNGQRFENDEKAARDLLSVGNLPPPTTGSPAEHATWTTIARVLFNLHEMIVRN
jgi:hypothetical protein